MLPRYRPRSGRTSPSSAAFAGAQRQQRGGREALGLHPEILVAVADRCRPARSRSRCRHARRPRPARARCRTAACAVGSSHVGGAMALQDQQQLGPFGLMAGLEAPGAEQVLGVVLVVVPVDLPARRRSAPRPARRPARRGRRVTRSASRSARSRYFGSPRGLVGREHRLAAVHVGVLAAVGRDVVPVGADLVAVQPVRLRPETLLHQLPGFVEMGARLLDAGLSALA